MNTLKRIVQKLVGRAREGVGAHCTCGTPRARKAQFGIARWRELPTEQGADRFRVHQLLLECFHWKDDGQCVVPSAEAMCQFDLTSRTDCVRLTDELFDAINCHRTPLSVLRTNGLAGAAVWEQPMIWMAIQGILSKEQERLRGCPISSGI